MNLWRICRAQHESTAFSGIGAEKSGGRWNFKGYPVVYSSENLSLAALELFVHVSPGIIPADLVWIRATLPDSIPSQRIEINDLPQNWQDYPAPPELQMIGTDWLIANRTLILEVPSVVNPQERNFLINPSHPDIRKLVVSESRPFQFDPRMFGK